MSDTNQTSGTLEVLLRELAILVSPLGPTLKGARAVALIESLGIAVTPAQAQTLSGSLDKVTNGISGLGALVEDIRKAADAGNWGTVLDKGIKAIAKLAQTLDAFATLANALGSLPGATPAIVAKLPERLFDLLLADYFGRTRYLNEALELLGILDRQDFNVDSIDPAKPFYTIHTFHLGKIGDWLSKPGDVLAELYDWGKPSFDGTKLFTAIDKVIATLGLPTLYTNSPKPKLDLLAVTLEVNAGALVVSLDSDIAKSKVELSGSNWTVTGELDVELLAGTKLTVDKHGISIKPPEATTVSGKASVTIELANPDASPMVLLGVAGSSRVDVATVSTTIGCDLAWKGDHAEGAFDVSTDVGGGHVLITTEGSDGFLATLLSGIHVENTFDLGIGFSTATGFYFHGSSALEIQLASHIDLGPIELDALTLSLGIDNGKIPVGLTTDIKASFGPIEAVIQGIGFALDFALASGTSGNLGPLDLSAEFVPPKGVGVSLDAGVVTGGGYLLFDTDRGEYGGALQIEIIEIVNAKAIGVITTKMPDGSKGFALIIIITAEFNPPFQLGYGFTLNGVGGLLGLNRAVDLVALRDGVKTDAIESILFPSDVIANAPQIISDLRTMFPVESGTFLIGPMAKLGWGTPTLISLAFGLILEIPTTSGSPKIAILGVLKIALPTDELDLVKIQINFIGTIDFDKGLFAFDASLYDSHLLFLTLEGDMAVRVKWKDPGAGFLVSIGGFHPSYTPPPELEVTPMKRLAVNILNTDWARIRVEVYFAVTSNTVQTGAKAELYFGFSGFYIDGYLGFDALFQFSPFYFEIGISAGLTLHAFGMDLLSIKLAFNLAGPSPWHAWGTGSITILFWDISADFDITWGDASNTTLPDVDVLPLVLADLNDPAHWRALPPPSTKLWVALRPLDTDASMLVLHPAGTLQVTQKTAPFDLTWERFGSQHPADIDRASLPSAKSGDADLTVTPVSDNYARSHFQNLSDAEKLSAPSFEPMHTGIELGLGDAARGGTAVERAVEFETIVIDKVPAPPFRRAANSALHRAQLQGTAKKRAPTSRASRRKLDPFDTVDKVQMTSETYTVASTIDNRPQSAASTFASHAAARDYLTRQLAISPSLSGQLHVLPASEVNRS